MFKRLVKKAKNHKTEILAGAIITVGVVWFIKSYGNAGSSTLPITTISPLPDEGVIIPWSILEELREKGGATKMTGLALDLGDFLIKPLN